MKFRVARDRHSARLRVGQRHVEAAELIVLSSQGNAPGVNELAAAFARASGHKVTVLNEGGAALEQRLANGPADLIMGGPDMLAGLAKKGRVVADSVTPYMLAGLGVSVRAGAPKPDISTAEAYTKTLLAAKSIGYSSGCSGQHVADGIAQLGLTEQLKPKLTVTTSGKGPVTFYPGARRLRDRHPADQHHGRRAGYRFRRAGARRRRQAVPEQRRAADGLEGAGCGARDDQVHDLAGSSAAAAQGARSAGQQLTRREDVMLNWFIAAGLAAGLALRRCRRMPPTSSSWDRKVRSPACATWPPPSSGRAATRWSPARSAT